MGEVLCRLAGRQDARVLRDPVRGEAVAQRRQIMPRRVVVGDTTACRRRITGAISSPARAISPGPIRMS
jgi:hypothetical protein